MERLLDVYTQFHITWVEDTLLLWHNTDRNKRVIKKCPMHLHLIHLQNLCHFNQLIKGFIRIKKNKGGKKSKGGLTVEWRDL